MTGVVLARTGVAAISLTAATLAMTHPTARAHFIDAHSSPGSVQVGGTGSTAALYVDREDWKGVHRAVGDLQLDFERVTGVRPALIDDAQPQGDTAVIVGTIGKSRLIDELVRSKKMNVDAIRGKWEAHVVQVIDSPMKGVARALVVAGSDKRGTIFGVYDISEQAGVSPWYWWADVPVKHSDRLFARAGRYVQEPPAVKYRGVFLNDEAPSLSNWVYQFFGDYKHTFYEHIFELLLRLKANYLWPAMWNNCFSEDDPLNPQLADEYGIVMGTSHVEPMMRADKEWNRLGYSAAEWRYDQHPKELEAFWKAGLERNRPFENIVTIAMRGKIDTPMSESANIGLLERIVADQRNLIANTVNPDVSQVPQLWALYKEVQEYYEKGMRVPDDVTLLWCDDNWGNIRRLPSPDEVGRSGGAGVYYHFDYVGDPRNYKWVNTNPLPRIWEQMNLAYDRGARQVWIVNVGDLKPKEFPTEFFLRLGWNPKAWDVSDLGDYTKAWTAEQFGPEHAAEIGRLLAEYGKFNSRRKPELLDPNTYSLINYGEADRIVRAYDDLAAKAEKLYDKVPEVQRDAYFEIVLYTIKACANLNALYVAAAKNRLYARQGRASAIGYAAEVERRFALDAELTRQYHSVHGGKWNHMMDQTHIGYTSWQQPDHNNIPATEIPSLSASGRLGVAVEGSENVWPDLSGQATAPKISSFDVQRRALELFNRGKGPLSFRITTEQSWLRVTPLVGELTRDVRVSISVDWNRRPLDANEGVINITGSDGTKISVRVPVQSATLPKLTSGTFVESEGCVSIAAEHFATFAEPAKAAWKLLPDLGREGSSVTMWPITSPKQTPGNGSGYLEYPIYTFGDGDVSLLIYLSPTQNMLPGPGLCFAISVDDEAPQLVNMHQDYDEAAWRLSVANNIRILRTRCRLTHAGQHTIRFWAVDPGVVLQKLVVDLGGVRESYLGPPESYRIGRKRTFGIGLAGARTQWLPRKRLGPDREKSREAG